MSEHIVWADNAAAGNISAPTEEKQHTGWGQEAPPFEWLNWFMNKTDVRLKTLETPWELEHVYSPSNTRAQVYAIGDVYTTPPYIVGAGRIRVYLDSVPCILGVQYEEVGLAGSESTQIRWKIDVDYSREILIVAPYNVYEKTGIINTELTPIQDILDAWTARLNNAVIEHHAEIVQQVSAANTRTEVIAAGTDYTVPEYRVGDNGLQVYLHGLMCSAGADNQYVEVGTAGTISTKIKWNDDIPQRYEILVKAPVNTSTTIRLIVDGSQNLHDVLEDVINDTYIADIQDSLATQGTRISALEAGIATSNLSVEPEE